MAFFASIPFRLAKKQKTPDAIASTSAFVDSNRKRAASLDEAFFPQPKKQKTKEDRIDEIMEDQNEMIDRAEWVHVAEEDKKQVDKVAIPFGPQAETADEEAVHRSKTNSIEIGEDINRIKTIADTFRLVKDSLLSACTDIDVNVMALEGYRTGAQDIVDRAPDNDLSGGYMKFHETMFKLSMHAHAAAHFARRLREEMN
ncbi:uncharacterized protein RCC_02275 [Ramularia collo-cygni]|uniref:Uncharacterized protein n=1 Tax=Ramularia collo-cygni TaxID=112498 RepID=A0A2D3UMF2_9PEZI|nr:uncharacterized protein RCC_02275 [Ramularia collo-cygni]CZT16432.1 uncharacterized protein RCC_02275 [Ramularia collo-cygni]